VAVNVQFTFLAGDGTLFCTPRRRRRIRTGKIISRSLKAEQDELQDDNEASMRVGVAVKLLTHLREVFCSNLGRDIGNLE
jgi:hypothetical protein